MSASDAGLLAEAHAALDRMGVHKCPFADRAEALAQRVIALEQQNKASVPANVWGGRG